MQEKNLSIKYIDYSSKEELDTKDQELLDAAVKAISGSYAPYSKFNVGAALRLSNGEIVSAANQENAAYPSGLCAERSAIFYAHSKFPNDRIEAIAVAAMVNGKLTKDLTYPCGACRQVLYESQNRAMKPIKAIIASKDKVRVLNSISDLLPFAFYNLPDNK